MDIVLMRHGEAADADPGGRDFERLLTAKGERGAQRVSRLLAGLGFKPQSAISSPAPRALATAQIACAALAFDASALQVDMRIYDGGLAALQGIIDGRPATDSILLVGHNPTLEQLATRLTDLDWPVNLDKGCAVWLTGDTAGYTLKAKFAP